MRGADCKLSTMASTTPPTPPRALARQTIKKVANVIAFDVVRCWCRFHPPEAGLFVVESSGYPLFYSHAGDIPATLGQLGRSISLSTKISGEPFPQHKLYCVRVGGLHGRFIPCSYCEQQFIRRLRRTYAMGDFSMSKELWLDNDRLNAKRHAFTFCVFSNSYKLVPLCFKHVAYSPTRWRDTCARSWPI